ncbi:hypothetical protein [Longimicrobium sp.]|uniref:hypothetical protein n=1 Tax=Longimicrobium sp. TaxID=2029185 RepID=UPI002C7C1072|nr:hypothetical protein [Longimicrobium sp.]HSU16789.1 hypothetical protein [Longimicrobium sp.]
MTRVERILRWVWLINGLVLLALLVAGGIFLLIGALAGLGGGDTASAPATRADSSRAEAAAPLRYDPPEAVRGSDARIVVIRRGTGYTYRNTSSSARGPEAPAVNVAFLDARGARLLLDRPAYIAHVRYPGQAAADARSDTLRWIVYEAALGDSNGDGRVDSRDRRSLYVSALDGRGFRRVLPDGYELRDWAGQADGSLVATAVQLQPGSAPMPERAFVLDASGAVRPYAALDSVVAAAGGIAGKP